MASQKKCFLIFTLLFFTVNISSQEYSLDIILNPSIELKSISYQKHFLDSSSVKNEISKFSNKLQEIGFFSNRLEKIVRIDQKFEAHINLGERIEQVIITITKNQQEYLKNISKGHPSKIELRPDELQSFLTSISAELESKGQSFSKVQLSNIQIHQKNLLADLVLNIQKKRVINDIIVKGYDDFPNKFLKNHFTKIGATTYSKEQLNLISQKTKSLNFVKETKSPEVLFKKDSTEIYLYIKAKSNNSVDANLNFNRDNGGGVVFNGLVDLQLENIFQKGNRYALFWNAVGNVRQELKFNASIPYIYRSKITPEISFRLFKQDSTFINTTFNVALNYPISADLTLGLDYTSESSNNLNTNVNAISNYTSNFFGLKTTYEKLGDNELFPKIFSVSVGILFGKRNASQQSSNQIKANFILHYLWKLNERNYVYLANRSAILNSDNVFDNERYRIGGVNSVRGFNDQSIYTDRYSQFTIEYRLLTNKESYFFTLTDFAKARVNFSSNNFLGLGLGYQFSVQNSKIRLGAAVGKSRGQNFDFSDTQFLLNWINFF